MTEIPPEKMAALRQIFIDHGAERDGRTADEWSDDEVIVAMRQFIKAAAKIGRELRAAIAPAIHTLTVQLAEMPVPPYLERALIERGRMEAER